jgi:hypothetical protein
MKALLRAVTRREVDVVAAWAVDRLGRSLVESESEPFSAPFDTLTPDVMPPDAFMALMGRSERGQA